MYGSAFVPGFQDTGITIFGDPLTLQPNHISPLSLIDPNPFNDVDPVLVVASPYNFLESSAISFIPPANTKYFRISGDGRNRWVLSNTSLTGEDLANIEAYTGPLSFVWDNDILDDNAEMVD